MSNFFQLFARPESPLVDHLLSVGEAAQRKAESLIESICIPFNTYDISRTAYIMGVTHDLGKSTRFFQSYLAEKNSNQSILKAHSPISSLFCYWAIKHDNEISNDSKIPLSVLASLGVYGHHGSLRSPVKISNRIDQLYEEKLFEKWINSMEKKPVDAICEKLGICTFSEFCKEWEMHLKSMIKECWCFENPNYTNPNYHLYYLTNLLFSILLDSDRLDAAKISYERRDVEHTAVKDTVLAITDNSNKINVIRSQLFDCLDGSINDITFENKILSITAPTGSGKTLSSLHFALQLRQKINTSTNSTPRIIYVAPFTSILDQTFSEFEKVFKSKGQSNLLLLHHHLAQSSYNQSQEHESYSTAKSDLLVSGWASEIIATTFIQFFNTVFGTSAHNLRRFHNLTGSIVILDEVQSIPFEYWDIVRKSLQFISKNYSIWFILMTATQPLIFQPNESIELVGNKIDKIPSRVKFNIKIRPRMNIASFCEEMKIYVDFNTQKNILIELNTIKSASTVYNLIQGEDIFYLSSHIIPKHRKPRIDEIKNRLNSGKRTVLVSTQVIEAGVDLDFDLAVRDIGPIDSIVQTAGRCNRNGHNRTKDSIFSIYALTDNNGKMYSSAVYGSVSTDIAENLLQNNTTVENLVESYFIEASKRKSSTKSTNINKHIESLEYDKINKEFNLIDEHAKASVFVEVDEAAKLIWQEYLNITESSSRTSVLAKKNLQDYIINISERDIKKANIREINGIYKINNEELARYYDMSVGFIGT